MVGTIGVTNSTNNIVRIYTENEKRKREKRKNTENDPIQYIDKIKYALNKFYLQDHTLSFLSSSVALIN
jgi:hypothetical protein